jgi:hypothetical protein
MKFLTILAVSGFFTTVSVAQRPNIFKSNPMQEFKLKRLLQDSLKYIRPTAPVLKQHEIPEAAGVVRLPLEGNYLGVNQKGDQKFAMSTDQMICLAAGKTVHLNMPVVGIEKSQTYPPVLKEGE